MNGLISTQIKTNSYIDTSTGAVIDSTPLWTEDVECKYKSLALDNKGNYSDGTFEQESYEITTDDINFTGSYIRLKNSKGVVVCEKDVQSLEYLESIQRVHIVI